MAPAGLGAAGLVITVQDAQTIGAALRHQFRVTGGGTLPTQPWVPGWVNAVVPAVVAVTLFSVWSAAIGRPVASWRRSAGDRRQQLKWLASGGAVFGVAVVPSLTFSSALWEVAALGFAALPAGHRPGHPALPAV